MATAQSNCIAHWLCCAQSTTVSTARTVQRTLERSTDMLPRHHIAFCPRGTTSHCDRWGECQGWGADDSDIPEFWREVRLECGDAAFLPLKCGELLLECRDATAAIVLDDVAVVVVWLIKNWLDPMRRSRQAILLPPFYRSSSNTTSATSVFCCTLAAVKTLLAYRGRSGYCRDGLMAESSLRDSTTRVARLLLGCDSGRRAHTHLIAIQIPSFQSSGLSLPRCGRR